MKKCHLLMNLKICLSSDLSFSFYHFLHIKHVFMYPLLKWFHCQTFLCILFKMRFYADQKSILSDIARSEGQTFEQQCKDNLSKFCLKKIIANLQFGRKIIQILNLNFANEIPKSHNYEIIIRGSEYIQMMQTLHHFRSTSFGQVINLNNSYTPRLLTSVNLYGVEYLSFPTL